MTDIFVYGTLKEGQPNHFIMKNDTNGQAEFVAYARTVDRYPLVIATKYNIPFLLNVSGMGQRVHGEIYRVDEKMLEFLDLEVQDGPGGGEHTLKNGSIVEAFVYSTKTYEPEWLQKPTYESYNSYGDHGLLYHED
ncbi:hypothetical protein PO909_014726 [Leuciscus waleckii]